MSGDMIYMTRKLAKGVAIYSLVAAHDKRMYIMGCSWPATEMMTGKEEGGRNVELATSIRWMNR